MCPNQSSLTRNSYLGKSTGAGALGIWTHNLKTIEFIDYSSTNYTGKAVKMGAGVQGFEIYEAASQVGLSVTGGICPTVGIAGGYTQGGGHSPLASKYGMGADQTLEWEVVTGTGDFVTASPTENSDLYWALSGGGGGTYGVVYSLTSKAHTSIPVSGANLTFSSDGISLDTFFAAIGAWHASLPAIVDAGAMALYFVTPTLDSPILDFKLAPLTGPGIPASQAKELLQPFLSSLDELNIPYNLTGPTDFPGFLEQYNAMQALFDVGVNQYGARLIPRSVIENDLDAYMSAIRNITLNPASAGWSVIALNSNLSTARGNENVYNAVLPAWRDALMHLIAFTYLDPSTNVYT